MARAGAASASPRSDSIKGLAQSLAKPAYRRLLTAEPALRRAVPILIIAFLATISVGAGVHEKVLVVLEGRAAGDALNRKAAPVDAAIVGIIDYVECDAD